MESRGRSRRGPYHGGEIEVQRLAGVRGEADRVGRIVGTKITGAIARLMADHRLAVVASLDETGRVWASLLTGPAGFLHPVDDRLMLIESHPRRTDPLAHNLRARSELGLLAIDLATRRRLRFNGRALHDPERGIFLSIEQAYGNCPRYIQARRPGLDGNGLDAAPPERSVVLSDRQRALVAAADTLFIASFHPEGGADASHRGGAPGFVRPLDGRTVAFGDYPGNNMFNTLGNLAAQPLAGLLFLDFETGAILQLTGRARLERDPGLVARFRGAQGVAVIFEIDAILATAGAGVRGRLLEASPANP